MSYSHFDCINFLALPRDGVLSAISYLDVGSLLRLEASSTEFHNLAAYSELWELRYKAVWPNVPPPTLATSQLKSFYRSCLFKTPRVRCDGGYVSRCVYSRRIQEGASLTDTRTFLQIVYHRIIRFLPDGTALMLISEKGGKGSARKAFQDLMDSDLDQSILDKYGRQLHKCSWRTKTVAEGLMVTIRYFDGKLCWSADLLACPGTERRHGGSRLEWYEYRFWDPTEVVDFRRRDLYRERESVGDRLRRAHLDGTDQDTLSDLLFQYDRLGEAMRSVRESHDDPVESVPSPLLKQITLCQEHFPLARFVHSSVLAHLF